MLCMNNSKIPFSLPMKYFGFGKKKNCFPLEMDLLLVTSESYWTGKGCSKGVLMAVNTPELSLKCEKRLNNADELPFLIA